MAHCTVTHVLGVCEYITESPGKEMWDLERLASLEEKLTDCLVIQQPSTKQF